MNVRTITSLGFLALALRCEAQLPVVPMALLSGSGTFWPTNTATPLVIWLELYPTNSARALGSQTTDPAPDNSKMTNWINLTGRGNFIPQTAANSGTNFVSGGGANGTSPRMFFKNNVLRRLTSTGSSGGYLLTNFTVLAVVQCSAVTDGTTEYFWAENETITPPWIRFNSNGKLEVSQGTTLSGPSSVGTGWNIIMITFAGASSSITTNGVAYVSGTVGTGGGAATVLLTSDGPNPFPPFGGNFSRLWVWTNSLTAAETTAALHQTEQDFGFPIVP